MIDFYHSQITDILPDNIKKDPIVIAIGYSISNALKDIVNCANKSGIYAAIDTLEEDILDLLAVELRTRYYGDWLSLKEKRSLLKKTLLWYCRAGTPYAVQELVDFVFQDAYVEEWFQYTSKPFLFRLIVNVINQDIETEKYISFLKAVYEVKNTRSHFEKVIFKYRKKIDVKSVAAGGFGNVIKVKARTVKGIKADSKNKPASALFLNQKLLVKAERIKENEVYTTLEDGAGARVFIQNGDMIKIG